MKKILFLFFALIFFNLNLFAQIPPVIPEPYRSTICARSCENNMGKTTFIELASNGARRCPSKPQLAYSCAPYKCNSQKKTCRTDCIDNRDCAPGFRCNPQTKTCFTVTYFCANHISLNGTDGSFKSCFPYSCQMGACVAHCASAADCGAGVDCNSDGTCGRPPGGG
ncbi:hypothetical protein [Pseudobdellovibrio sp. HCB154]|uniref:hypothetical protein n=1 Tax=Pseudobdellovibrio sp. HCB154 TaxID=3386277 RepID=UPI003916CFC6